MDELYNSDWMPISNTSYITKYIFCETGYQILASDLINIYSEELDEAEIQKRFKDMNTSVEMKSQVIIQNLKKSLQQILFHDSKLSVNAQDLYLTIKLQFPVAHANCAYNICMRMLPPEKVQHFVIRPLILGALMSQRKVVELQKKVDAISSLSSDASPVPKNFINPDWLKGSSISDTVLTESFLKLQNHFKQLSSENCETYFSIKREKRENTSVSPNISPKKSKHIENDVELLNIKFEDEKEESKPIKNEVDIDMPQPEPVKAAVKKKKVFKI